MQERCPNCGNYFVGPAYPVPERALVRTMFVCCVIGAFVGSIFGGRAVYFFFSTGPGSLVTTGFVFLGALIGGTLTWFPFSMARDRKTNRRNSLAHIRRCSTCGLQWSGGPIISQQHGWTIARVLRNAALFVFSFLALLAISRTFVISVKGSCTMHYDQAMMIVSPDRDVAASLGTITSRHWVSGAWYDQRTEPTDPTTGYIFAGPFNNRAQADAWSTLNAFGKDGAAVCVGRYTG